MFNLPEPLDVVIFEKNSSWTLPNKARMVYFWACGAGGGGGGGCSGPQDTQRGGGAGGSPANAYWGFMPSLMFPDNIYFEVPIGGVGGGPDQSGTSGGGVAVYRESLPVGGVQQYTLVAVSGGIAGGPGTTTAGGSAGATGSTIYTIGFDFSDTGLITGGSANNGGSGGATGTPVSYSHTGGVLLTGGTGGGGCAATYAAAAGGTLIYNGESLPNRFGGSGNATQGGNGIPGFTQWLEHYPFVSLIRSCGGTGGGNSNTGTGGNGGYGGYGSGGGGGGAGLTGGRGGDGGPGLLIIAYW